MSLSRTTEKALNRRIDKYMKVTLTNAQMLSLNATPVSVLTARAGFTHCVTEVYATCPAQATGATIGSATALQLRYTNASGAIAAALPVTGFIDGTTAKSAWCGSSATAGILPVVNAALVAYMAGADVTAMTGTVSLRIYFKTLPATL